jgi:ATP-binding protein involved in chromosome partitioning
MFGKKKEAPAGGDRKAEVLGALATIMDPDLNKDIVSLGFVKNLTISGDEVAFTIELTTPACPVKDQLRTAADTAVKKLGWPKTVQVEMTANVRAAAPSGRTDLQIKNIIAVASGKGGVGKSTVATNLAFALKRSGARVGLMDADIYGPSVPHMLGIRDRRPATEVINGQNRILPIEHDGLKVMSMGFLVDVEKPVIWRGPMVHSAVKQFFGEVLWGELDYLVIDLPPGTGDIQLTMVQNVPLTGAVIVTTPQDVAMIDARKAFNMFKDTNVAILGIVENMSLFKCPHCGETSPIFGHDGARAWAERTGTKFLGAIPLDPAICAHGEAGVPAVAAKDTAPELIAAFTHGAEQVAAQLSIRHMVMPQTKKLELST